MAKKLMMHGASHLHLFIILVCLSSFVFPFLRVDSFFVPSSQPSVSSISSSIARSWKNEPSVIISQYKRGLLDRVPSFGDYNNAFTRQKVSLFMDREKENENENMNKSGDGEEGKERREGGGEEQEKGEVVEGKSEGKSAEVEEEKEDGSKVVEEDGTYYQIPGMNPFWDANRKAIMGNAENDQLDPNGELPERCKDSRLDPKWMEDSSFDFKDDLMELSSRLRGTNVYLVGMPGTGKSLCGRMLSEGMQYQWADLDDLIEGFIGKTSTECFETEGEPAWREYEYEFIKEMHKYVQFVFSTGGGVMTKQQNIRYLQTGLIIWLDLDVDSLYDRLKEVDQIAKRPLLMSSGDLRGRLSRLLEDREENYALADIRVKLEGTDSSIDVVRKVVKAALHTMDLKPPKVVGWEKKQATLKDLWKTIQENEPTLKKPSGKMPFEPNSTAGLYPGSSGVDKAFAEGLDAAQTKGKGFGAVAGGTIANKASADSKIKDKKEYSGFNINDLEAGDKFPEVGVMGSGFLDWPSEEDAEKNAAQNQDQEENAQNKKDEEDGPSDEGGKKSEEI